MDEIRGKICLTHCKNALEKLAFIKQEIKAGERNPERLASLLDSLEYDLDEAGKYVLADTINTKVLGKE